MPGLWSCFAAPSSSVLSGMRVGVRDTSLPNAELLAVDAKTSAACPKQLSTKRGPPKEKENSGKHSPSGQLPRGPRSAPADARRGDGGAAPICKFLATRLRRSLPDL